MQPSSQRSRQPWWQKAGRPLLVLLLALAVSRTSAAYSFLTHEQLIDLAWRGQITPLLLTRFPKTTAAGLAEAHSYAYGGSAIQDLGYYPFGKPFLSDLTHYVRTGDFIASLFRNARDVNEYAFAIGAFSHYLGDNIGHHDAVNRAAALAFPQLAAEYGPVVTYDENPHAHVRTEFGFDISEISRRRLAPAAYLHYVGFKVSRRLLAQAFVETYDIQLRDVMGRNRPSFRAYRFAVRSFLPRIAYAENVLHRKRFAPDPDPAEDSEFKEFCERVRQADFQTVWNQYRRKAGIGTHLVAGMIFILPRVGPLSDLAIKIPTPQTKELYFRSVNRTVELLQDLLTRIKTDPALIETIPNRDLDTGERTRPGTYKLTDETYANLLHRLTRDPHRVVPRELVADIADFYADPNAPIVTKKDPRAWKQLQDDLTTLQRMPNQVARAVEAMPQ